MLTIFYRYERSFGSFSRTVALPPGVDEDAVQAEYRNGVLRGESAFRSDRRAPLPASLPR
ncbi:MAG: Hsp20/alpha crystallin family protein [Actinobacteria bacterium]|nr:Hsp20/alpha crystallin family protein [Actinomycetota bacterium]